ncbi:Cullin repeat-like-containing domain protein [Lactarius hatsudake]|nr:Cullin repeat-like-containing domain protein [Lactarius hatsudake]
MESLRSKSVRKGPRPVAAKLNKPSKNARKSRVDDKIKRRMSARYATISAPTPTDTSPPSVPTIPLDLRGAGLVSVREKDEISQVQTPTKEDLRAAENRLLDVDDFDPDAYLKLKLANSTEAELRLLQSSLRNSKDEVAADLQRNVFKNYAQFVHISKEIGILENEMLGLKESLAEWKSMPSVLHIEESASVADRRRNVRSSVADLRVLYAHQMQNLHTQIEGSAKFVPTTPGRHVVAEMDSIFVLNAATYKPISAVRFVLLDDAVLVARRRRRRNASESDKLVADRCWPLNEMLVLDTKDTATLVNVFKIKHGKETHVYRTDSASDKKSLLSQFRHVAEELAAKKRKEREGEHERRKSLWTAGGSGSVAMGDIPPVPDWMSDLAQQAGMSDSAKENAERDARWIGDFADELNVAIALREWDRAVELVEQGQTKLATMPLLATKLTPLTASLTAALLQALSYPQHHKEAVKKLIALLIRLDAGAAARTTFLTARTETARRLVRMIRFDADWFLASFKENEVASSFIEWAKSQIETFAEMFRIQVFCTDVDKSVVDEALSITHNQSRKLLQEFGLDFRFILDALLVPNPLENVPPQVPILAPAPRAPLPTRQTYLPVPHAALQCQNQYWALYSRRLPP